MSKVADLRKRLEAINDAMRGTFAARFAALNPEQRDAYDRWRNRCEGYCADQPDGGAYERLLLSDAPPPLRADIRQILFGPAIQIPTDATLGQLQDIYARLAHGD